MRLSPCWVCATARDASTRAALAISRIRIVFKSIPNSPNSRLARPYACGHGILVQEQCPPSSLPFAPLPSGAGPGLVTTSTRVPSGFAKATYAIRTETVSLAVHAHHWPGHNLRISNHDDSHKSNGWTLVWSDEFDGPNGSPVDRSRWAFDIGGQGRGNRELEY
jgi:hypothetical protein